MKLALVRYNSKYLYHSVARLYAYMFGVHSTQIHTHLTFAVIRFRQQNKHPAHQVAQPNHQQLEKFALHI